MPAIDRVLETSLYVDNLACASAFYTGLFGFEVLVADARMQALAVPGGQVLLLFRKGASLDLETPHGGSGQLHLAFAISADSIEEWDRVLEQHNIPIESRVTWKRGGHSLYFRDPDGHLLELVTPGCWSVY